MKRRLLLITVLAMLMVGCKQPMEEVVIDAEVYNNIYELISEAECLGHIEKVNEIIEEGTHQLVSPDGNFKYTEDRENITNLCANIKDIESMQAMIKALRKIDSVFDVRRIK